jgi:uncharacterized protein
MFAQNTQLTGPVIASSGSANVQLAPDHAIVSIGISTRNETARGAASDNGRSTASVLAALRKLGIPVGSLNTSGFTVEQAFRYENNRKQIPDGFAAQNAVKVETDSIAVVPEVLDAALGAGATSVSVQFSSSNATGARVTLVEHAYAAARSDALALAHAAGGSLGALLWAAPDGPPVRSDVRVELRGTSATSTPVILPGNINTSVTISARWAFIPGAQ